MANIRKFKGRRKWYMQAFKNTPQEFCLPTPYDHSPENEDEAGENEVKAQRLADTVEAIKRGYKRAVNESTLRPMLNEALSDASKVAIAIWLVVWVRWHCLTCKLSLERTWKICQTVDRFLDFANSTDGLAKPEMAMGQATADDLLAFLQNIHDTLHLCPASVNECHGILSSIFGDAVKGRVLVANPASWITLMEVPSDSVRLPFAIQEILKILRATRNWGARGKEWEFVCRVAAGTAIRLRDICILRPGNFRWDEAIPRIVYKPSKLKKFDREQVVRLNDELAHHCKNYLDELEPDAKFCTPMLAHSNSSKSSNSFGHLLDEAGIDREYVIKGARRISRKTFQCFRHFVVSMLKANGCTLSEVMEFVGHTTIKSNLIYTHKIPGWDLGKARAQTQTAGMLPPLEPKQTENDWTI